MGTPWRDGRVDPVVAAVSHHVLKRLAVVDGNDAGTDRISVHRTAPVALATADVCHAAAPSKRDARSPAIESQIEIVSNSARKIWARGRRYRETDIVRPLHFRWKSPRIPTNLDG